MKRIILLSAVILLITFTGCNKEEAIMPSADFTTNIQNNTLKRAQSFTVYLDRVEGEFLVYFRGNNETNTYSADDPTRQGTNFSRDLDSLLITGYNNPGDYVFTIVASSSGNWAKDYFQDIKSIQISVVE